MGPGQADVSAFSLTVDGLELPVLLAGHPALEFCNTLAGWNTGPAYDYLRSYEHLVRWAGHAELITAPQVKALVVEASTGRRRAAHVLAEAVRLRASLYAVLTGEPGGAAFEELARAVHAAARELRLHAAAPGARLELGPQAGLRAPVHAVAWSAAQLLGGDAAAGVRACPGPGCGWLFLDPRGRRRWCSMATCGNRAKARRYAERHRE